MSGRGPLRWMLVGDSVAYSLLPTFESAVTEFAANRHRRAELVQPVLGPGLGLTADLPGRNDVGPAPGPETFTSWRAQLLHAVVTNEPLLVVVLLGVWDTIDRRDDGTWRTPGDAGWRPWYRSRVDDALRILGATGAPVVWVLMPCTGRPATNLRLHDVNAEVRTVARRAPDSVATIDLDAVACTNGVPRADTGEGRPARVRMPDGVHFDPEGAAAIVRPWLVAQLEAHLASPPPGSTTRIGADAGERVVSLGR